MILINVVLGGDQMDYLWACLIINTLIFQTLDAEPGGGGRGLLRFELVGDVFPAAQNPYLYLGVIFPKIDTHIQDFFWK